MQIITGLPTYLPKGSTHQPPDGGQLGDSFRGSSPRGDPPKKPLVNPHVGYFGWPTPSPHMFIPPWYQPLIVQLVSEPTTKLPYKKLQYPTYVKNTDPNAHIRIFKKAIKANGEIVEANIINLFGFTLRDSISKWGENYVQDQTNYTFENLEQTVCEQFKTMKNDEEVYMQLQNIQQQTVKYVEVDYEHMLKLANYL